ncbi:MAG TPA: molybdopterin molybdenumtransferase MoeA [Bacteroidetes bacterium]|nr:molybdopterin molybdenumtransferase MoeA [Bacteroidota bacterium]
MVTTQQATRIVLSRAVSFGEETVSLQQAVGRILREDLVADRDFPPFDRVSMDGIAIQYGRFANGQKTFKVEGLQAAGAPQMTLADSGNCLEVMTGAVLPKGTDTVVRYEDVLVKNDLATVQVANIKAGQNVHRRGMDRRQGEVIVKKGSPLSPAEIGVAATIGKPFLRVARLPRVAIVSTGDELVDITERPRAWQIRKSNVHNLAAAVSGWGIEARLFHLPDDKKNIRQVLSEVLDGYQAILLSGGVSAGKLDFVPEVLEELQVEKLFHKVSQRPGKPFWFGASEKAVVFAFPGNPVSSFMCLHRYFRPWLRAGQGLTPIEEKRAVLGTDFYFRPDLTYFLQVKIRWGENGQLTATPIEGKGSGDLANLVDADAFMELPKGRNHFSKGESFRILFYR